MRMRHSNVMGTPFQPSYRILTGYLAGSGFDGEVPGHVAHNLARIVLVPHERLAVALNLAPIVALDGQWPSAGPQSNQGAYDPLDRYIRAVSNLNKSVPTSPSPAPRCYDHIYAAGTDWLNRGGDE